jgi:hypothetical protein
VSEAGAEAEAADAVLDEPLDVAALLLLVRELDPRREQELAPREPGRGVDKLADVNPPDRGVGRMPAREQAQPDLVHESVDGQHRSERLRLNSRRPGPMPR